MDGWPAYWERMTPMHYATHVVSPCLGLVDGLTEYVSCFGSGRVRDDIAEKSKNRFAVETCHIKIKDRQPRPNAVVCANWTCVGICAHESANLGGEIVHLPDFTQSV